MWIVDISGRVSQDFNVHSNNIFKGVINKKVTCSKSIFNTKLLKLFNQIVIRKYI